MILNVIYFRISFFFFIILGNIITPTGYAFNSQRVQIISHTYVLNDISRNRKIPVETYVSRSSYKYRHLPVVIINHGYGAKNTEYSSLAHTLATQGYYVVSIQHDLKTDPPLARTGDLFARRKPLWERGVVTILFVLKELHRIQPNLDLNQVILIGHSNGGDIAMLFAQKYPQFVKRIISLDSLRMPFPRNVNIPILTIRANDTQADQGVLPNNQERKQSNIIIIKLKDAKHIDLCDRGSKKTKEKINQLVLDFLKGNHPE